MTAFRIRFSTGFLALFASALLFIGDLRAAPIVTPADLQQARDRMDVAALDGDITKLKQETAQYPKWGDSQYRLALAYSYAAEVTMQLHQKSKSESYAESGIDPAHTAIAIDPGQAEYHRLLGQLCAQVIPADPILGAVKYGQCARDEIDKAIQLNSKLAIAYVTRGVGNYYLPEQMGGGVDLALKDFDKAIALDPKLTDAYVWKGIALRKSHRENEAHMVLARALSLDPASLWTKEQLDKTPAQ